MAEGGLEVMEDLFSELGDIKVCFDVNWNNPSEKNR